MKILLSQNEIEQAVREFVGKGVSLANGAEMTVEFSMGRGDNGLTAAIDVPYMGVSSLPITPITTPAPVLVNTAPRVSATAPAPATETVVVKSNVESMLVDEPEQGTAPAEAEGTTTVDAAAPANGRSLFQSPAPK